MKGLHIPLGFLLAAVPIVSAELYYQNAYYLRDPFQYGLLLRQEVNDAYIAYLPYSLGFTIGYWAGAYVSIGLWPKMAVGTVRHKILDATLTSIFWILVLELVFKLGPSLLSLSDAHLQNRVYIGKYSLFKLAFMGLYASTQKSLIVHITLGLCVALALVDMTREALVAPFIILVMARINQRRWALPLIALLVCVFAYMYQRDFRGHQLDLINAFWIVIEGVSYGVAGLLHVAEGLAKLPNTGFNVEMLLISISPFPSSIINTEILESRNLDLYRPFGAFLDLHLSFPIVLLVFWSLLGFIAGRSSMHDGIMRAVLITGVMLIYVLLLQYSLRTSFKLIFVFLFISLASNKRVLRFRL